MLHGTISKIANFRRIQLKLLYLVYYMFCFQKNLDILAQKIHTWN